MHLVLGNKNYSSWSLRPWLLLKHFDIAFTEEVIPLFESESKRKLAAINEAGKVPVLIDEGTTIWDSLAICEYINDHYLNGAAWPSSPNARALARSCSAEMHSGFQALRNDMPMNCRASNRAISQSDALKKDIERIDTIWTTYRSQHQSKQWLFGDFSIADCMFAPVAFRFMTYSVELNELASTYMRSLLNHPGMREWLTSAKQEKWVIKAAELG